MLIIEGSGPALAGDKIAAFEKRLAHSLPDAYRRFLLEHNGGIPEPDVVDVDGLPGGSADIQEFLGLDCPLKTSNLDWYLEAVQGRIDERLLPIACDSFGCLYCLSLEGSDQGSIIYWDFLKGASRPYPVAPSFEAFLAKVRPFEEDEKA